MVSMQKSLEFLQYFFLLVRLEVFDRSKKKSDSTNHFFLFFSEGLFFDAIQKIEI